MSEFDHILPWGGMKRVILNVDGTVAYELDPGDSNKKADGSAVDWDEVESLGQNCMVQIPKFWFTKKADGDIVTFGVSDRPKDDWVVHPAFYRQRDRLCDIQSEDPVPEVEYRYIGAFHGWQDSEGRLRSLPNKSPVTDISIVSARNAAKKMGNGYGIWDYYLLYAIQMLYITEYGHPDSQTQIGRGYVDGNSAKANTGATLECGNNTFGEETGKVQMSYRGIEDFWGNVYNWTDGVITDSSYNILIGNKGFNNKGNGYGKKITTGLSSDRGGNITDVWNDVDAGFIIKDSGKSYTTGGLYDEGLLFSDRVARFGGFWNGRSNTGAFQLLLSFSTGNARSDIGTRLVF